MEDRVCAGEARAAGGKTGHENGAASRCRPSTIVGELSWPIHERSELDAMISGSGVANLLGIAILRRVRADVAIVAPAHAGMPLPSLITNDDIDAACSGLDGAATVEMTPEEIADILERRCAPIERDETGWPSLSAVWAHSHARYPHMLGVLCEVDLRRPVGQRVCSLTMSNGDKMPRILRVAVACNTELAGCRTLECCGEPLPKIVADYVAKHSLIAVKAYGCTRYCW